MNDVARQLKAENDMKSRRTAGKPAFSPGDSVVYPGHGVGSVTSLENQRVGEHEVKLLVIAFVQDRMTLRVPLQKVNSSGLRRISTAHVMEGALAKLKEPPVQSRAIWNRRALEYSAKINSGNPFLIAEVVRDLHSVSGEHRPSHCQRLLYEQALGRLIQELAAIEDSPIEEASVKLELLLNAA